MVESSSNSGWEDIPVSLGGDDDHQGDDDKDDDHQHIKDRVRTRTHKKIKTTNHYDNVQLGKQATVDLPAQPGEEIGMMYGGSIQVLRGDQYQVIHDNSGRSGQSQKRIVLLVPTEEGKEGGKEEKKKKVKNPKTAAVVVEQPSQQDERLSRIDDGNNSTIPLITKKKKKKEPQTTAAPTTTSIETQKEQGSVATKKSKKRPVPQESDGSQSAHKHSSSSTGSLSHDEVDDDWLKVQQSWSHACGGAMLDPILCRALSRLGFVQPTPIQAATLSASILGRRNLVGAAPTGSGKTLAFLLPILQSLLQERQEQQEYKLPPHKLPVPRALIVTPTRELATQIYNECEKLLPRQCVTLVGGIAPVKQARLLSTIRPPILVGTPGRLWQMISSQEHEHLKDLSQIQFLVLDEADRMTQEHSFPQLIEILERVHLENRGFDDDDTSDDDNSSNEDDEDDRLLGLPGIRGEAKTTMLTPELLQRIQEQREAFAPERKEVDDDAFQVLADLTDKDEEADYDEVFHVHQGDDASDAQPPVHRQTFIYSATLTLPYTSTKSSSVSNKKKRSRRTRKLPLEGGLAEILEKTHAMGETKVVDLSSATKKDQNRGNSMATSASSFASSSSTPNGVKLPPGLRLEHIRCTQLHKDSHLYAYLLTTAQGASGPALVFCNSIAAVRRVGTTLQMLGLTVRILHAHMQQRARYKAVESLSNENTKNGSRVVVVCTDVAARGLDIPSVATVIHYDVARAVDTFVHRAGRTARGMGKGAVGASLSLIAPAEDKAHSKIAEALEIPFHKVLMDGRLLTSSQERVNLACKVVSADEKMKKMQSQNAWFLEKAKEADMELDDDLLEDNQNLTAVEQGDLREAARARGRLAQLLVQPMTTQRFGKFLSTNSAAMQKEIAPLLVPSPASTTSLKPTRKKRKV